LGRISKGREGKRFEGKKGGAKKEKDKKKKKEGEDEERERRKKATEISDAYKGWLLDFDVAV
jgi:hypothetical protein